MYRVIVVDDHPMICSAVRALLEGSGAFEVVAERSNGSSGLAATREMKPDLLIIDLDIPILGGMEVIRRVRMMERSPPILVVSAADPVTNGIRALRMGANGFVYKGGALNDLVTAATLLMQGKSFFDQEVLFNASSFPKAKKAGAIESLSERELEVFRCLAQGQSNIQIGAHMLISSKSVSAYKRRIMDKLGLSNIRDLIELAKEQDVI